jgi:hypothetical protein
LQNFLNFESVLSTPTKNQLEIVKLMSTLYIVKTKDIFGYFLTNLLDYDDNITFLIDYENFVKSEIRFINTAGALYILYIFKKIH